MKYYMNEQGLLEKEEKLYIGLVGFEDLIKELDEMSKVYNEVQARFEEGGYIYLQDLENMKERLVEFNQRFIRTHEALAGKIK